MMLLGATMWWPLSARLAMALIGHGCSVSAVCPHGHPLRFVQGIQNLFLYRGLDSLGALKAAIVAVRPDIIVPCDDGVVWQLHKLHAENVELRSLIEYSLGPAEMYSTLRSRGGVLQAAAELGIRIPITEALTAEEDIGNWGSTAAAVVKLDGTWGGSGVEIVHSTGEAVAAFRSLAKRPGAGVAWKRLLVNRDPLALWLWRRREETRLTIQQFISGRPANTMFACWEGEVLGIVTVEVLCAQGATGAATVVRLIHNAEIEKAVHLLAKRFKLNGFHGLDFILEQRTGAAYLIELNPRCTQLGHLRLPGQGDLAGVLSARLQNDEFPQPKDVIRSDTIAFFPQAFSWNPKSPYLSRGYHDVPWEEPKLVRQLLRETWPNRQWPARVYHFFRAPQLQKEVNFDEALSERSA